jgi:beta-glucosidase
MGFSSTWLLAIPLLAFSSSPARSEPPHVFPPGFKWCVATSAHQIEGANSQSDWWDWEADASHIRGGERSGAAADHWNRVAEDIGLMKSLNVQQYRFSVEWAKLEPREGQWDAAALAHYRDEIRQLIAAGIEPLITLHHFTLPRWVAAHGGWEWDGMPAAFEAFTRKIYTELGAGTRDWVTINEPLVVLLGGYVQGIFPPGRKGSIANVQNPLLGMLRAHAAAYHALHELAAAQKTEIRVGMAHHLRVFDPKNSFNPLDHLAAGYLDGAANWAIPTALETGRIQVDIPFQIQVDQEIAGLRGTQDFFGVNYYSRDMVDFNVFRQEPVGRVTHKGSPTNELGWEIYPEGFYRVLKKIGEKFRGRRIVVTENGVADASDQLRGRFIQDHVAQMYRAMTEGVPVDGYCHWSLLDNFEWAEGFAPRFGLVEVDYATQRRAPRPSAQIFSRIAAENGF